MRKLLLAVVVLVGCSDAKAEGFAADEGTAAEPELPTAHVATAFMDLGDCDQTYHYRRGEPGTGGYTEELMFYRHVIVGPQLHPPRVTAWLCERECFEGGEACFGRQSITDPGDCAAPACTRVGKAPLALSSDFCVEQQLPVRLSDGLVQVVCGQAYGGALAAEPRGQVAHRVFLRVE